MQTFVVKALPEWCVSIACSRRLGVHGSIPEEDSWVYMHNLSPMTRLRYSPLGTTVVSCPLLLHPQSSLDQAIVVDERYQK